MKITSRPITPLRLYLLPSRNRVVKRPIRAYIRKTVKALSTSLKRYWSIPIKYPPKSKRKSIVTMRAFPDQLSSTPFRTLLIYSFSFSYKCFKDCESMADVLNPLTISHTAKPISCTNIAIEKTSEDSLPSSFIMSKCHGSSEKLYLHFNLNLKTLITRNRMI